jgi:hypothetical protein
MMKLSRSTLYIIVSIHCPRSSNDVFSLLWTSLFTLNMSMTRKIDHQSTHELVLETGLGTTWYLLFPHAFEVSFQ